MSASAEEFESFPGGEDNVDAAGEAETPVPDCVDSDTASHSVPAEDEDGSEALAADPLAEAMASIAALEDELARARADFYNLTQEYNGYVKRSKAEGMARYEEGISKVANALLPVLDDVQLAREHGDLDGAPGQIVEKLEQTLSTNFKIERFGAVGETFDPMMHEALMHSTSPDVSEEQIGTLIQPGYRMGEKLLRPARVAVVSPE